jgi:hypothetical protein
MRLSIGLTSHVRAELERANLSFEERKTVGGVEFDFLVRQPDGGLSVLELKAFHPIDLHRAVREAERRREAAGADSAFVVIPESAAEEQPLPARVVTARGLIAKLEATRRVPRRDGRKRRVDSPKRVSKQVFAAMPFDEKYDDVFFVAIAHAAKAIGAKAYRVDQDHFAGDIVATLKKELGASIAVIADISGAKANVLYETGYAHALGLPTVHICSTPLHDLPFDVSHWNTLEYKLGQVHAFRTRLARRLKELLKKRAAA